MKILDLFCCAGGAGTGYSKAGFEVTGVDIKNQPNYPFNFIRGDVLEVLKDKTWLEQFDAVHASPPCQGYSHATKSDSEYVHYSQGKQTPKLIEPLRDVFKTLNKPYVIENVAGAKNELINPFFLTGYMFDLPIQRRRYFETNFNVIQPIENKKLSSKEYARIHGIDYRDMSVTGKSRRKGSIETWKRIMDMPWAKRGWELVEAIPPAYTQYIGRFLIQHLINKKNRES